MRKVVNALAYVASANETGDTKRPVRMREFGNTHAAADAHVAGRIRTLPAYGSDR